MEGHAGQCRPSMTQFNLTRRMILQQWFMNFKPVTCHILCAWKRGQVPRPLLKHHLCWLHSIRPVACPSSCPSSCEAHPMPRFSHWILQSKELDDKGIPCAVVDVAEGAWSAWSAWKGVKYWVLPPGASLEKGFQSTYRWFEMGFLWWCDLASQAARPGVGQVFSMLIHDSPVMPSRLDVPAPRTSLIQAERWSCWNQQQLWSCKLLKDEKHEEYHVIDHVKISWRWSILVDILQVLQVLQVLEVFPSLPDFSALEDLQTCRFRQRTDPGEPPWECDTTVCWVEAATCAAAPNKIPLSTTERSIRVYQSL